MYKGAGGLCTLSNATCQWRPIWGSPRGAARGATRCAGRGAPGWGGDAMLLSHKQHRVKQGDMRGDMGDLAHTKQEMEMLRMKCRVCLFRSLSTIKITNLIMTDHSRETSRNAEGTYQYQKANKWSC